MRPQILFPYFAALDSLPGLGPKTTPLVAKLVGGDRILDLLFHLPVSWIDRRPRENIAAMQFDEIATVRAHVNSVRVGHGSAPTRIRLTDDTGVLTLVYFRANPRWLQSTFPMNKEVLVSGKVEDFNAERQIVHPDHVCDPEKDETLPEVEPVYRMSAGVTGRLLQKVIKAALETVEELPPWSDPHLIEKNRWPGFLEALKGLHRPEKHDPAAFELARKRLAYDEVLAREVAVAQARLVREKRRAEPIPPNPHVVQDLLAALPFQPTHAQMRAYDDIRSDMSRKTPMRRIVQGDVGAGKTLVAALAIAQAAAAGKATLFMSPTEVLARQQAEGLENFLAPLGFHCAAFTGRNKASEKKAMLDAVAKGELHCLSGTQALYQDSVVVDNLGLIVIDEQHRFGVADRMKLTSKGIAPHTLMMSATPIPRTLSAALQGDLQSSILDEKPAGRKPIVTRVAPTTRVDEVMQAVAKATERGERAFWVCPAVDSEEAEDAAAERRRDILAARVRKPVALVHGKLAHADKDAALEAFRKGDASVLVATTVVEVGVDVPEATIMVIEHAEKFGLAQLHQLRGRVGRGDKDSSCLLLYKPPLTQGGHDRLDVLRKTEDGFEIAEADFKQRGPGDLLGLKQSGLPDFRVVDLTQDAALFEIVRSDIKYLINQDPDLDSTRGQSIRLVRELFAPRASEVIKS
ncbi:MAG: ATP-dependent DNA helicase RecG [Hirschia sp.]|mgnify:CR=1 FL=1|nr:ATP-dependent DNA helicase RecG [Hirschia sp.]MBF20004.1 ATP-dependent DNA helicase RecG [Hirschia sp.]